MMWTYSDAGVGERRNSVCVWTAAMEERGGSRWIDLRKMKPHYCALRSGCRMRSATSRTLTLCMGTLPTIKHVADVDKSSAVN